MNDYQAEGDLRRVFDQLGFVTDSDVMLPVLQQARKAALVSDVTILLEGETGSGKQVLAQAIHALDVKRRSFPIITVHCGTVNEALAESEFFGHTKGAFSGALTDRQGLFRSANQGTVFLDDVNDLPLTLQAKLLDVIQRRVVRPIGADQEKPVDVRIMAACNLPLKPLVLHNRFRSDLYYRLNVVKIMLPPLHARMQDVPKLILALAHRHRDIYQPIESVAVELVQFLQSQPLSGNVRELENTVQGMLFCKESGTSLRLEDWLAQASAEQVSVRMDAAAETDTGLLDQAASILWKAVSRGVSYKLAIREVENKVLEMAVDADGGTRRQIARRLGTSERTLYSKIRGNRRVQSAASAD